VGVWAGGHVDMDVDEARRDIVSSDVDGFRGLRRRNVRRNCGNLAVLDRDIVNGDNVVPGVDHVAARDQQVVVVCWRRPPADRTRFSSSRFL
jgi:hypothetical protein